MSSKHQFPRDMLIFRGGRSRCSPVRLAVDQSRFLFKDSSYMVLHEQIIPVPQFTISPIKPNRFQMWRRESKETCKTTTVVFFGFCFCYYKLTPLVAPGTWRTSSTKGCHGANAWNHQPHATTTYALCFPVQWKLHLHTSQFDNLILQKVNKNMHKSKLVSSSSQNFKVRIPNPK